MNDAEVFAIIGELANQDAGRIASLGFPEKKKEETGISSVPASQSWQFATANTMPGHVTAVFCASSSM